MRIRYMSDLHLDLNGEEPLDLVPDDTFTVIAGDISADVEQTIEWISANIRRGVIVEGNHVGYATDMPIEDIHERLREAFPIDGPVSFLENAHKRVNAMIVVGATLWTDYACLANRESDPAVRDERIAWAMIAAEYGLNDFNYNQTRKGTLRPADCLEWHRESLAYIDRIARDNPDSKIVVVTHHAPSLGSINRQYANHDLTPAFASSLDDFILSHPNISRWIHGHVHASFAYNIGKCRVLCNPRGYVFRKENPRFSPGKFTLA